MHHKDIKTEISYRKFCGDDRADEKNKVGNSYTGRDQKQIRAFIGLGLREKRIFSHVQLCQLLVGLTFAQMVNLTTYVLNQFMQCGFLDDETVHCVDSTELASECQKLLAKIEIKGRKIGIYNDGANELLKQTGVNLVKPANSKVRLPPNVDEETMNVTLDDLCEIPMEYNSLAQVTDQKQIERRIDFRPSYSIG